MNLYMVYVTDTPIYIHEGCPCTQRNGVNPNLSLITSTKGTHARGRLFLATYKIIHERYPCTRSAVLSNIQNYSTVEVPIHTVRGVQHRLYMGGVCL
jgi:hypothetical protein